MSPHYQYIVLHQSCRNSLGVIAVQAAHAAAESVRGGPAPPDTHVVALVAEKSDDLVNLSLRLHGAGIHHVLIQEPNEPYNGAAIALGTEPMRDRDIVRPFFADFKVFR